MSVNRPLAAIGFLTALAVSFFLFRPQSEAAPFVFASRPAETPYLLPLAANALEALAPSNPFGLADPVAQFQDRITLKTFGMHISPGNSPVENDRFAGYHTGVDAEFTDTPVDIPVVAVSDGVVVTSKRSSGYGGIVVVRHSLEGIPLYVLYGHLDPASLIQNGTEVKKGQQLGILGDDHSEETDGVRKHLHLAFFTGTKMDYRGYVPTVEDLALWLDPLDFY